MVASGDKRVHACEQIELAIAEASNIHAIQHHLVERLCCLEGRLANCLDLFSGQDAKDFPATEAKAGARFSLNVLPPTRPCNLAEPSTLLWLPDGSACQPPAGQTAAQSLDASQTVDGQVAEMSVVQAGLMRVESRSVVEGRSLWPLRAAPRWPLQEGTEMAEVAAVKPRLMLAESRSFAGSRNHLPACASQQWLLPAGQISEAPVAKPSLMRADSRPRSDDLAGRPGAHSLALGALRPQTKDSVECSKNPSQLDRIIRPTQHLETILAYLPDSSLTRRAQGALKWIRDHTVEPERKGILFAVSKSYRFEALSVFVIIFNAGFVAYVADTEMYHVTAYKTDSPHGIDESAQEVFKRVEIALLSFYAIELLVKVFVHGRYLLCNEDWRWNIFDLVLILFTVTDILLAEIVDQDSRNVSFMRVCRFLRLSKIVRLLRAFQFFSALRLMLNAVSHSFIMLFWAIVMLIIILFVMSLIFVQGVSQYLSDNNDDLELIDFDEATKHFGSVWATMISLYMCMTGGNDWIAYYDILQSVGPIHAAAFLIYTFFFVFALFNILTGMVVENVTKAASRDDEVRYFNFRMKKREDCRDLARLFHAMDKDSSGSINAEELQIGLRSDAVLAIMDKVDLDPKDAEIFFAMLASISSEGSDLDPMSELEVDINAFVYGCMNLRGPAAGIDLQALMFETRIMAQHIKFIREMVCDLRESCHGRCLVELARTSEDPNIDGDPGRPGSKGAE